MKYIIIPIFRVLILPLIIIFVIFNWIIYLFLCLWNWNFENLFQFEDFSLNKNKPLFIKFTYYSNKPIYHYDTLLDYILNRKKYKSKITFSSNKQDDILG